MTLGITTLSKMTHDTKRYHNTQHNENSIITVSKMTPITMTISITTLSIITHTAQRQSLQ
jgi:hypothetical protein